MSDEQAITSRPGGPLIVSGDVPLVRKTAVHSEHGEPLAWKTSDPLETRAQYALCRCGDSANKPFCDGSHTAAGFEGADPRFEPQDTRGIERDGLQRAF